MRHSLRTAGELAGDHRTDRGLVKDFGLELLSAGDRSMALSHAVGFCGVAARDHDRSPRICRRHSRCPAQDKTDNGPDRAEARGSYCSLRWPFFVVVGTVLMESMCKQKDSDNT